MLNLLPLSTERDGRELELVSALIQVLYLTKGYTAPEFVDVTERANALAEKSGNIAEVVRQGFSTWTAVFVWGEHRSALALADRLLDLGRRDESSTALGFAHSARLQVCFNIGDLIGAEQHFGHLTGFLEAPALRQFAGAIEFTLGFASLTAWMLGRSDSARERIAQVIAVARDSKNPYDLASGLVMESWLYRFLREPQPAEAAAKRALVISEERGFSFCRDFARIFMGSVRAQLGGAEEGTALIRQGMAGLSEAGVRVTITDVLTRLAEAQCLGGKIDDALNTIEEALHASVEEIVFRPNILRCRGELRLKVGQNELAETDFREAIVLARGNGAKALELRAATSLAYLLGDRGKRDEAYKVLAEIYNRFTQGFDTADLKDAKILLDRLTDGTLRPPRSGRGLTPKRRSKR
jgi:tetratricopeptide (TPR) repeat protein